jgi:cell division protease FtsH
LIFGRGETTTGAAGDFEQVSRWARLMVTQLGMSDLGLVALEGRNGNEVFLGGDWVQRAEYSREMAHKIDQAMQEIILQCYGKAQRILAEHRPLCDRLVDLLLEVETLDGETFRKVVAEFTNLPTKALEPLKF